LLDRRHQLRPNPNKEGLRTNHSIACKEVTSVRQDNINMLLANFLALCNIPINNKHVSEMIEKHEILDWKVFIGASLTELTQLGFKWGPA
jgi:hypothetical protein